MLNSQFPSNPWPSGERGDLRILAACPMCQSKYHPLKTEIMAERDGAHLVYLVCRQCAAAVVAVVTAGVDGLSSVGTLTDLTSQELTNLITDRPVTDDDVVDLYQWLERDHNLLVTPVREKEQL